MRRLLLACTVVLVVVTLSSCASQKLASGKVVEKNYLPERSWVQMITIPQFNQIGKATIVTYITVPMFHHQPEAWQITIEGKVDGETVRRCLYVTSEGFDRVQLGQIYAKGKSDSWKLVIDKHQATVNENRQYGVSKS